MTDHKPFRNWFLLTYKSKHLEEEYFNFRTLHVNRYNKIMSIILTIVCLVFLSIIIYKISVNKDKSTFHDYVVALLIISSILCIIDAIGIYISFCIKNIKIQDIFCLVLYIAANIHLTILKVIIEVIYKVEFDKFYFINNLEYIIRAISHFLNITQFNQTWIINILFPIATVGVYHHFSLINSLLFDNGVSYFCLNISLIFSSYFVTRRNKEYCYTLFELKNQFHRKIEALNNLNGGYMKIEKGKITYINKPLKEILLQTKIMKELDCNDNNLYINTEKIAQVLFGFLSCTGSESFDDGSLTRKSLIVPFKEVLNKIHNMLIMGKRSTATSINLSKNEYVLIGYSTLNLQTECEGEDSKQVITLEIVGKFETDNSYEFIFKDVTQSKEDEQKKYESKIKNVFLTKISHEFKNPLVSLKELIEQLIEEITKKLLKQHITLTQGLKEKLNLMNSFLDYCFILINDLEYFTDLEKPNPIEPKIISDDIIDIKEFLVFCEEIANSTISYEKKSNLVGFIVKPNLTQLTKISADIMKLKQILTNIITNVIYFTKKGDIILTIAQPNRKTLTFTISFPADKNRTIFHKEKDCKFLIVKRLLEMYGNELHFVDSDRNSVIWFDIPIHSSGSCFDLVKAESSTQSETQNCLLNSSAVTLKVENLELNIKTSPEHDTEEVCSGSSHLSFQKELTIIFIDDEDLTRKSIIRVISHICTEKNLKLNILEGEDGCDILNQVYSTYYKDKNKKIDGIICDQKMKFIDGTVCQNILINLSNKNFNIPFYIVTAFDKHAEYFSGLKCSGIFGKPLQKASGEVIVSSILEKLST